MEVTDETINETIKLLQNLETSQIQKIKHNIHLINFKTPFLMEILKKNNYRKLFMKFSDIYHSFPITVHYNKQDSDGKTTLMYLIERNYRGLAIKFINSDAIDLNIQDSKGNTALVYAIKNGSPELIFPLIYSDANINIPNNQGTTPLMVAIMYCLDNNIILLLINKDANLDGVDNEGLTALMIACISGNYGIVKILANQYNINRKTNYGYTALMYAAMKSYDYQKDNIMMNTYINIVRTLLERGASFDPNEPILKNDFKCAKIINMINMIKNDARNKISIKFKKKRSIAIKNKKNILISKFLNEFDQQSRIYKNSKYIILTMELLDKKGQFQFKNLSSILNILKQYHRNKKKVYDKWKCSFLTNVRTEKMEKISNIAKLIHHLTVLNSYRDV